MEGLGLRIIQGLWFGVKGAGGTASFTHAPRTTHILGSLLLFWLNIQTKHGMNVILTRP